MRLRARISQLAVPYHGQDDCSAQVDVGDSGLGAIMTRPLLSVAATKAPINEPMAVPEPSSQLAVFKAVDPLGRKNHADKNENPDRLSPGGVH
jgi:hypothetical protein